MSINVAMKKALAATSATAALVLAMASISSVLADAKTDAIAERISSVANVCMAGADCPTATTAAAPAAEAVAAAEATASGPRDPETIYKTACFACHEGAIPASPKLGDMAAWAPRIAKGMDALYQSAMNGTPAGMPPKGACVACSEEEIKATVEYMVGQSR